MQKNNETDLANKTKILVVDDEKRIRDVCYEMLTGEGFLVSVANDGFVGMEIIQNEHFDIVLLDLMMPGISGMDLLEYIKEKFPDTIVIVITGYATLEHGIGAIKNGAFDFLPKPFSPEDLRLVIKKALDYMRTLQDIANEKSRMRTLINHLGDGVMATDAEGKIALANPAFLKMIGFQGKNVIGMNVQDLIKNERLNQMIKDALNMKSEGFSELTEEFEHGSLSNDEELILGVRCIPFRDHMDRNLGTITVTHDITTLKQMERLKSDFVSMVAHEIKGPINSVLMQIKVFLDGLAGHVTDKQIEILTRVSERLKALSTLSVELLDLAKIESGLITIEKEKLDTSELLKEIVAFHQARALLKKIELVYEDSPDLSPMLANKGNMEEVFSNLISNAIKYTPDEGRVIVSVKNENDYVCVSISDTGFGIPEKDLPRVFERFFRVKNKNTRLISGTGLGLSIVKNIIEAHNGTISVTSKLDEGTIFTVYIPAAS
jgi:two-component system, OmpR family, phosphate regulon sensor histidine kinase PhoR